MPQLDESWKPERCGFIIRNRFDGKQLVIDVDPAKPDAWRKEPFFSRIHRWAQSTPTAGQQIVVLIGRRAICIFPEEDIDVGELPADQLPVMAYQFQGEFCRPVVLIKTDGVTVREVAGRLLVPAGALASLQHVRTKSP